MKIIIVGPRNILEEPGGIEVYVKELYSRIIKTNSDYNLILYNVTNSSTQKTDYYKGIQIKNIFISNKIPKEIEKFLYCSIVFFSTIFSKFDLIHFHGLSVCWYIPIYRIFRKNVFYTNHSNDFKFKKHFFRYLFSNILRFSSQISNICISHASHITYGKKVNYLLPPIASKKELRNPKIKNLKNKYILYGGRFTLDKGAKRFLNLARLFPEIQFYICGILNYNEFKFPENVSYLGSFEQPEFFYLIKNSLAIVCPSYHELMDMTFLESVKLKVKIIASNIESHIRQGDIKFQMNNILIVDFENIEERRIRNFLEKTCNFDYKDNIIDFNHLCKKYLKIYEDFNKK